MTTNEQFAEALQEALNHLHDPTYLPPELMWLGLGLSPEQGIKHLQAALIEAMEALKPADNIPAHRPPWRDYNLLHYRYIQRATQVETAQQVGLTTRHARRAQKEAVHNLARLLWTQYMSSETPVTADSAKTGHEADSWQAQVRQELAHLQQREPEPTADVADTIAGVVKVGTALAKQHQISLQVDSRESNLRAAFHPALLRQILLTAIEKLVGLMDSGCIFVQVSREATRVTITVTGSPVEQAHLPDSAFMRELLATDECRLDIYHTEPDVGTEPGVVFQITIPTVRNAISVLVVDDNRDLVTFYRRYTTDTPYQISHLTEGETLFDTVATLKPDIIVLDVMLPGRDGWDLLTDLQSHADTESIPIIVCSVIKREALARSLGAALYLPKPVRRRDFLGALEAVSGVVSAPVGDTTV